MCLMEHNYLQKPTFKQNVPRDSLATEKLAGGYTNLFKKKLISNF